MASAVVFNANFDDGSLGPFVESTNSRYAGQKVVVENGGVKLTTAHQHYGLAAPVSFVADGYMAMQYSVEFTQGVTCGGAYVKLLEATEDGLDLTTFDDSTNFVIMFGPDKCGETDKVHFILRQKNPISGEWVEHHLQRVPRVRSDRHVHLYSFEIKGENIEMFVDGDLNFQGSLFESLEPPLKPPAEIDDPEDVKPEDWVDEPRMDDPNASKPDDWDEDAPRKIPDPDASKPAEWYDDEPATVPDPEAERPKDWDDEEDGVWEAPLVENPKCAVGCGPWERPMIPNPEYKGKWTVPKIDNPKYKGQWAPRKIKNPYFFEPANPPQLPKIGAVAIEIWTTNGGFVYDNFALGRSMADVEPYAKDFYEIKKVQDEVDKKKQADFRAQTGLIPDDPPEPNLYVAFLAFFEHVYGLVMKQPAVAAATVLALLVAFFALIFKRKGTTPQPASVRGIPPQATNTAAADDDDDDDADEDDNKAPRDDD